MHNCFSPSNKYLLHTSQENHNQDSVKIIHRVLLLPTNDHETYNSLLCCALFLIMQLIYRNPPRYLKKADQLDTDSEQPYAKAGIFYLYRRRPLFFTQLLAYAVDQVIPFRPSNNSAQIFDRQQIKIRQKSFADDRYQNHRYSQPSRFCKPFVF